MACEPFKIKASKEALKQLEKFPKNVVKLILKKIENLALNPYLGKPLRGRLEGLRSLRVGEYRALYYIDQKEKEVRIITIGPRKKIYKNKRNF